MNHPTMASRPHLRTNAGHSSLHPPEWNPSSTPQSAVSSFNLPASYENLMTPVTATRSPCMSTHSPALLRCKDEHRLAPSPMSSEYLFGAAPDDDDLDHPSLNPPMKYKGSLSADLDSPFTEMYHHEKPYYGMYGVSATPMSASGSSPSVQSSPGVNSSCGGTMSAGGYHSDSRTPSQQHAAAFRNSDPAPILIAPNPAQRRAPRSEHHAPVLATTSPIGPPTATSTPSPRPQAPRKKAAPSTGAMAARRRRKRSSTRAGGGVGKLVDELPMSDEMSKEERFLLHVANDAKLNWEQKTQEYNKETKKNFQTPALQMMKTRLQQRLRVWTETDERALVLASQDVERFRADHLARFEPHQGPWTPENQRVYEAESANLEKRKWREIARLMMDHDCLKPWPPALVKKKCTEDKTLQCDGSTLAMSSPRSSTTGAESYQLSNTNSTNSPQWTAGSVDNSDAELRLQQQIHQEQCYQQQKQQQQQQQQQQYVQQSYPHPHMLMPQQHFHQQAGWIPQL